MFADGVVWSDAGAGGGGGVEGEVLGIVADDGAPADGGVFADFGIAADAGVAADFDAGGEFHRSFDDGEGADFDVFGDLGVIGNDGGGMAWHGLGGCCGLRLPVGVGLAMPGWSGVNTGGDAFLLDRGGVEGQGYKKRSFTEVFQIF